MKINRTDIVIVASRRSPTTYDDKKNYNNNCEVITTNVYIFLFQFYSLKNIKNPTEHMCKNRFRLFKYVKIRFRLGSGFQYLKGFLVSKTDSFRFSLSLCLKSFIFPHFLTKVKKFKVQFLYLYLLFSYDYINYLLKYKPIHLISHF